MSRESPADAAPARRGGPKTATGKARSSRNATSHGLNVSLLADPAWSERVMALGRLIAGESGDDQLEALACRIASAQLDLIRVRFVKRMLAAQIPNKATDSAKATKIRARASDVVKELIAIERYERRAMSRRKTAIRQFHAMSRGMN